MASSPKTPADPVDARLVRKMADILNETGLSEIEVERGDLRIRVAKTLSAAVHVAQAPAAVAHAPAAPAAVVNAAPDHAARGEVIKSPMVGTVYLRPQPDAAPFVGVGDRVEAGATLLIVEAMKTMNPIPAPRSGRIVEVLVGDGQPVEFGEPLVIIE